MDEAKQRLRSRRQDGPKKDNRVIHWGGGFLIIGVKVVNAHPRPVVANIYIVAVTRVSRGAQVEQ